MGSEPKGKVLVRVLVEIALIAIPLLAIATIVFGSLTIQK